MSSFVSFTRRCAAGLVASQMLLGAVSVSTLALAAPVRAAEALPIFEPSAPAAQPKSAPAAPPAPPQATPVAVPPSFAPQAPAPAAAPAAPAPSPFAAPQPAAPQAPAPKATPVAAPEPAAPAAPAPQGVSFLAQHGDWQGFTTVVDGETVVGAMTRMNGGGIAAFIMDKDGNLELMLADPRWKLRDGTTVPVRLTIDGQVYTLVATAHGNRLEMPRVTKAVLQSFAAGNEARFDAGQGAVVWTLDLDGFLASMQDAAKVIEA